MHVHSCGMLTQLTNKLGGITQNSGKQVVSRVKDIFTTHMCRKLSLLNGPNKDSAKI